MSKADESPVIRLTAPAGEQLTPAVSYTFRDGSHLGTKPEALKMAERDLTGMIGKYRAELGSDILTDLDRALEKVRWRLAESPSNSR